MPIATRAVFDRLYNSAKFKETGATLMGDTALSLLIGHRLSEYLEFFFFKAAILNIQRACEAALAIG